MKGHGFHLVLDLAAAPERVFAACTQPELMLQWYGPQGWRATRIDVDPRPGGRFCFRMTGPEGEMGAEGEYEIVEAPRRIVHTWRWTGEDPGNPPDGGHSRIRYEIEPRGEGSRLTFTHEALPDQAAADSHREGWNEALAKLRQRLDADVHGATERT